jgi:hypothetical protein
MLTNWMSIKLAFSFDGPAHIPLHAQVDKQKHFKEKWFQTTQ